MRVVSDKRERAPAYGRLPIEDSLAELGYCGETQRKKLKGSIPTLPNISPKNYRSFTYFVLI